VIPQKVFAAAAPAPLLAAVFHAELPQNALRRPGKVPGGTVGHH